MKLLKLLSKDLERLCEITGTSATFLTKVGYKSFNRLLQHRLPAAYAAGRDHDVAADTLRLGFDALKDPYTLLGRPLIDSPHIGLMRALDQGHDPTRTEYFERLAAGTLSQGLPVTFDEAHVRRAFQARDQEIRGATTQWVETITIDGTRYILDGKHRSALSFLRGARVHCLDVTPIIFDSYFRYFYFVRPSYHRAVFRKHLEILGPAYERGPTAQVAALQPVADA